LSSQVTDSNLTQAGGLLVKYTEDLLSVFYFAGFGHLIFVLSIFFILPESLSEESRAKNIEERRQREEEDRSSLKPIPRYKKIFAFLSPLTIFLPREREVGERGRGKDWNLTLIAGAYAVNFLLVVGVFRRYNLCDRRVLTRTFRVHTNTNSSTQLKFMHGVQKR
jgi:hypothetical protein